jgi:hypothetical protein
MGFLQFLFEGKIDDFKKLFNDKFTPEQINAISKVSKEVNSNNKFLIWMGKSLTETDDELSFGEELSNLQELLLKFNKIGSNLPISDINKYKSINELSDAIKIYENKQRRSIKKVDGADIIYDDDDYTVIHPKTYTASCFYGKGSKWCVSSNDTSNYWYEYDKEYKLFFFLSKKLPTSDRFYKVALLLNYDGKTQYWDAPDNTFSSGWILNTKYLNKILGIINQYMSDNYSNELEKYSTEEKAKQERLLNNNRQNQDRINRERSEAEERRQDAEWDPDNITHGDVGSKAWALFTYITENDGVRAKLPSDEDRLLFIENELERLSELQSQYELAGEDLTEIDGDISSYEAEQAEILNSVDVYDMLPNGSNYEMTIFKVLHDNYDGYEYTVGDQEQIENAAYEYEKSLISDYDNLTELFNKNFLIDYIDEESVIETGREFYNDWIYNDPESYLEKTDRLLSKSQLKEINEYKEKIKKYQSFYERAEERQMEFEPRSSKWLSIEKGLEKLTELIGDLEYDIENITEEPDGDWDENKINSKIEEFVSDIEYNPLSWLTEMGLNINDYIDIDKLIEGVISSDGYYTILNPYDGDGDEITWDGETYHIMNTDR